jgi:alpha-mannosidase
MTGAKRIYLALDDHTDYMWTADEETYRQAFIEMIDFYLDLADATEENPPEHQSRWNCDGHFWLWTYEKNKSEAEFARLIERIKDGHISAPLNALVSCYGATPTEAVLRGMYYPGQLERRHGVRFPVAIAMENQTLPYGLGALWAGAGAKYSWKGICCCATVMKNTVSRRRPHEIYWWRGPDGSRLLMKWNSFFGTSRTLGSYAEAYDPVAAIALVDADERFTSIYPYRVIGVFGKGWDHLKTVTDEFVTVARAYTNAERRVIVSNQEDFFADFEESYGRDLPAFAAGFGNEWDLYSASMAEVSARVRRAVERLRAAEALATLVSLHRPRFMEGREAVRDQAWMGLGLYWEHDWTADSKLVSREARADWQRKIAAQIEAYPETLLADAATALGELIPRRGTHPRLYAFNPLSWSRTDCADLAYDGTGPVRVIDLATGEEVPAQLVRLNPDDGTPARQYLRVLARDVPPVGYKVFEVQAGEGQRMADAATVRGHVIESDLFRVTVADRGAITSLVDKTQADREFAATLPGRAINDLEADSLPSAATAQAGSLPSATPRQAASLPHSLEVENAGPVSVTLKAVATAPLAHTTRITLFRDVRRIEIHNEITQNFSDVHTWAFSFSLPSPDVWHEEVGAVIRARLLADGGHYAPTHARLDWLTLNHFADMTGAGDAGVTLSNADCAFMRLGESVMQDGVAHLDVTTPRIEVLAGGQVDGPGLGIRHQGGDAYFVQRFALQPHGPFHATDAMRFALEHQNPLVTGLVTGDTAPLPERSFSLVTLSDPDVLLWALKPAEEGIAQGIIARVWNQASEPRHCSLALAAGIAAARRTTHIETDLEDAAVADGALSATIAPSQLLTFRLLPGRR